MIESGEVEEKLELKKPKIDDLYIICYTSGTTGFPKGVMLSQKNALSGLDLSKDETSSASTVGHSHISYLPLAHLYEQFIIWLNLSRGVAIGFYSGDPLKLLDDV